MVTNVVTSVPFFSHRSNFPVLFFIYLFNLPFSFSNFNYLPLPHSYSPINGVTSVDRKRMRTEVLHSILPQCLDSRFVLYSISNARIYTFKKRFGCSMKIIRLIFEQNDLNMNNQSKHRNAVVVQSTMTFLCSNQS